MTTHLTQLKPPDNETPAQTIKRLSEVLIGEFLEYANSSDKEFSPIENIVVIGSRDWNNAYLIKTVFDSLSWATSPNTFVLDGGAAGADTLCRSYAGIKGLKTQTIPAEWRKYGKRAGYIRNKTLIDSSPDIVLAFRRNMSAGTTMTIKLAMEAHIPILILDIDGHGQLSMSVYNKKFYGEPEPLDDYKYITTEKYTKNQ
jgi:hypothetical protein